MFMLVKGLDWCLNVELQHWEFHSSYPEGWIMMKLWRKRLCCSCACCSCTDQLILRVLNKGILRCCACPWLSLYLLWQVKCNLPSFGHFQFFSFFLGGGSELLNAWNVDSCLHQLVIGAGEFKNVYLEMQPYSYLLGTLRNTAGAQVIQVFSCTFSWVALICSFRHHRPDVFCSATQKIIPSCFLNILVR